MKKLIFIFVCFFSGIYFVNAQALVSESIPYYVKVKSGNNEEIINVKKIRDKDTQNVVFNVKYYNYDTNNEFTIYKDYDRSIWQGAESLVRMFNTAVYYGYNSNPSDLNYFLTQVIIWNLLFNYNVIITDVNGNSIDDFTKEYNKLFNAVNYHYSQAPFFSKGYTSEIWSTNKHSYIIGNLILDNPITDDFTFTNINKDLYIYPKKVGNYKLEFSKKYEQESYCYSDGTNVYWQSLKGPSNVSFNLKYNVYGTKLNIIENLIGVNNRLGDARLSSKYELYLDDELKLSIDNLEDLYVKSNSNYFLKDVSNNEGIINIEDINFQVEEEEYTLNIDKYVISKNISLDINSSKTYYVYLKSNNELYETVDNSVDTIMLPYGVYYVKDKNDTYYKEIIVEDSIDELLVIEEEKVIEDNIVEIPKDESNDEEIFEEIKKEEIKQVEIQESVEESNQDDVKENEDKAVEEEIIDNSINIENPQTFDDINYHIYSFCFSFMLLVVLIKVVIRNN